MEPPRASRWSRVAVILVTIWVASVSAALQPGTMATKGIVIDGLVGDWKGATSVSDPAGDATSGGVDLLGLSVTDDGEHLFLELTVATPLLAQQGNQLTLLVDTDGDPTTGMTGNGIGAELEWVFGARKGSASVEVDGRGRVTKGLEHEDIGLAIAPSTKASVFEVALDLTTQIEGTPLFSQPKLRLVVKDGASGDRLPDKGALTYVVGKSTLPAPEPIDVAKPDGALRIMAWNVLKDGVFAPTVAGPTGRILEALAPDVAGIVEVYDHTAQETATLFDTLAPLPGGASWYAAKVPPDCVVVSRTPIIESGAIGTNGAFVVDTTDSLGGPLLLVVAHTPCCDKDMGRQKEVDEIVAYLGAIKAGKGELVVPPNTPMVVLGDFNLVGDPQQLVTLLGGGIVNDRLFGKGGPPDWDDTPLADLVPRHSHAPFAYTWYDEGSAYYPGRLDVIVYSDSVLGAAKGFVLSTPTMPSEALAAFGLEADDTLSASDHLPLVMDAVPVEKTAPK